MAMESVSEKVEQRSKEETSILNEKLLRISSTSSFSVIDNSLSQYSEWIKKLDGLRLERVGHKSLLGLLGTPPPMYRNQVLRCTPLLPLMKQIK